MLLRGSVQSRDTGHENPCPLLSASPGWAVRVPLPPQSSHEARVCQSLPSVTGCPCISDTPFLCLVLLTGWVGWKEVGKRHFEGRYFPLPMGRIIPGRRPMRCPGRALRLP